MAENGFLTERDRQFLTGEKEYTGENAKQMRYQARRAIRERTRAAFDDFALLCDVLEDQEWGKIFSGEPKSPERAKLEDDVADVIKFLYVGMGGESGFRRPLKLGVSNGEVALGNTDRPFNVDPSFTVDPVRQADVRQVAEFIEEREWDRLHPSDVGTFLNIALYAEAIDFDAVRRYIREQEWFAEYRMGKKRRAIPGGKFTPWMDHEVYERERIDDMTGEELRDLFGEGYPTGSWAIYDGEVVYDPPEMGTAGEPEIVDWVDESDGDDMPTTGDIYDPTKE
jgi:hypothetical protein